MTLLALIDDWDLFWQLKNPAVIFGCFLVGGIGTWRQIRKWRQGQPLNWGEIGLTALAILGVFSGLSQYVPRVSPAEADRGVPPIQVTVIIPTNAPVPTDTPVPSRTPDFDVLPVPTVAPTATPEFSIMPLPTQTGSTFPELPQG